MRRSTLLVVFLALAAVFALGLRADGVVSADSSRVTVQDAKAESKFPDGILFRVRVSNPGDVKTVTVHFSIVGGRVQRYDYLPAPDASTGTSEVLIRTGSDLKRYIPPGVLMEYYFEVEDTIGNVVSSQPKRFIFDDSRFTWHELKQGDITIRYYGPMKTRAQTVVDAVDTTIDKVGRKLFGLTQVSPVRLTLYNNWNDMVNALPLTSRTQRGELITEGTTFSDFGIILLLADDAQVRGLASHEMTHFLIHDALGNDNIPVWMNEGLAEYANLEPSQVYEQYLSLAIVRGTLKPLTSLTQMPGKSEDVMVVYGLGRSVMEYLIESEPSGTEKLRTLFRLLRAGQGMDSALTQAYGFDRFGLDQRWRKTIGLPLPEDVTKTELPKAQTVTAAPLQFPQATTSQPQASSPTGATGAESDKPRRAGGACSRSEGASADVGMWLGLAGALAFVAVRRRWRG